MDIVSKIWVIVWFVLCFYTNAMNVLNGWTIRKATIGFFIVWLILGWIPAAIWLLL